MGFASFLNALNRNVWAGFFVLAAVAIALLSTRFHELLPVAGTVLGLAGAAFNGKE